MKKYFTSVLLLRSSVILLLAMTLFITNSCKKDTQSLTSLSSGNEIDLSVLQKIYNNDTINASTSVSMINTRNVKWDRIYLQQRAKSRVIEFDLAGDNHIWTKSPNPANYLNKASVVFIDFNNGTRLNFYMKVIEDHTDTTKQSLIRYVHYNSVPAGFNGEVMFYSLTNQFINGYNYVNGKIVSRCTAIITNITNGGRIQSTNPKIATMSIETYCVGDYTVVSWDAATCGCSGGSTVTYNGDICFISISDDGSANGGGGAVAGDSGGSGGGDSYGSAPQPDPCNTPAPPVNNSPYPNAIHVIGGHAVIQQVAGCPPVIPPPTSPDDAAPIQDAIDPKFRCAKSILAQLSTLNSDLARLLNNAFNQNSQFTVTFHDGDATYFASKPTLDGETRQNPNNRNISDVYISPSVLLNASNEYIIATMYHEALHAYLNTEYVALGAAGFQTKYPEVKISSTWHFGGSGEMVQDFYIDEGVYTTKIVNNDPQHRTMAQYFTDNLVNAILAYNPSFDPARARDLARGGIFKDTSIYYGNISERDRTKGNSVGTTCP